MSEIEIKFTVFGCLPVAFVLLVPAQPATGPSHYVMDWSFLVHRTDRIGPRQHGFVMTSPIKTCRIAKSWSFRRNLHQPRKFFQRTPLPSVSVFPRLGQSSVPKIKKKKAPIRKRNRQKAKLTTTQDLHHIKLSGSAHGRDTSRPGPEPKGSATSSFSLHLPCTWQDRFIPAPASHPIISRA